MLGQGGDQLCINTFGILLPIAVGPIPITATVATTDSLLSFLAAAARGLPSPPTSLLLIYLPQRNSGSVL